VESVGIIIEDHVNRVYEILMDLAPHQEGRDAVKVLNEKVAMLHHKDIGAQLQQLTSTLYDGLTYGNWPWE
jgi:hypothetical protein